MRYKNMTGRKPHSIVCGMLLALTLVCFGCQDYELDQSKIDANAITYALYSNGDDDQSYSPATRSAESPIVLVNENGTDSLTLFMAMTNSIGLEQTVQSSDKTVTRGATITNGNLISKCSGEIALDAFYLNESFIQDVLSFNGDGSAHTQIAYHWPAAKDAKIDFWSYHPKEIDEANGAAFTIVNGDSPSLSFYYSMEGEDGKLIDVEDQKDLFLAYTNQGKEQGAVNLHYDHALSAIKFVSGKRLQGEIINITLTDVCARGKLTYKPNEATKLSWDLDEDSKYVINQNFNAGIDEDITGGESQAITSDANETTFLLIPQTISGNTLTITYRRPEGDIDTYKATMPTGTWEIGKTYTYTLRLMDGLDIEATAGSIENKTINGVDITNAYNKPCYMRAMIIGNWVDDNGNIAGILNTDEVDVKIAAGNSNYQLAAGWDTYWFYDATANIYYYKRPVMSTCSTEVKLFERFTNPISHSEGLKLDFLVLVQAVEAEVDQTSVKAAWGDTIAAQLEVLNN